MSLFNSDIVFRRGDKVRIKYMDITGYVVDIDGNLYLVSYLNENDREVIEAFTNDQLEKD